MIALQVRSNLKRLALAGAASALLAPVAGAATLEFDFVFENLANSGGTVTGVIRGLQDNATGPASSVEVLTNTAGFGIGEYVGTPFDNSWTVVSGVVTAFDFTSLGNLNTAPAVTSASLRFGFLRGAPTAGLSNLSGGVAHSFAAGETLGFTLRSAPAVIPLPAAGWLLLGGLGVLAGLGEGRSRAWA